MTGTPAEPVSPSQFTYDPAGVLVNALPIRFSPDCGCNVADDVLLQQIDTNIRRGLPQIHPHPPNDLMAIIVCGGPSLPAMEKQIVADQWAGGKVVAVNGAYQWCLDRNIMPAAAVMIDARESNARFFAEPLDLCKYFLAAQCHPSVFELCRGRDVWIWHLCSFEAELELLTRYYFGKDNFFPATIGSTVGVRAIQLMRMLGFIRIKVYGMDACWLGDDHHAYRQPENDGEKRMPVWLVPRDRERHTSEMFTCSPWHVRQAKDFQLLVEKHGHELQLSVEGPGLIATMLRIGASIAEEEGAV